MKVLVGVSDRWVRTRHEAPVHLLVDVANRQVLACTGGAAAALRPVPFDAVREGLVCGPCRTFWRRASTAPNA